MDAPWLQAGFQGRYEKTGKLEFTKTYDGTGGAEHAWEYRGLPSPDKTMVEGTWGDGGGRFTLKKLRLDAQNGGEFEVVAKERIMTMDVETCFARPPGRGGSGWTRLGGGGCWTPPDRSAMAATLPEETVAGRLSATRSGHQIGLLENENQPSWDMSAPCGSCATTVKGHRIDGGREQAP